jgi:hypothetical protein
MYQGRWFFDSGFFQGIKTGGCFSDSETMKMSEPDTGSLKIQITLQHWRRDAEHYYYCQANVASIGGNNCHFASCAH